MDAEFAAGIRTAYAAKPDMRLRSSGAAESIAGLDAPQVIKLKGGLLNDYEESERIAGKIPRYAVDCRDGRRQRGDFHGTGAQCRRQTDLAGFARVFRR